MAFITDPDDLNQGTEVVINSTNRTIELAAAGNLADVGTTAADNGVTGQALYSFLKEEWRTDANLIKFPFPMIAITPEQFEFVDDWVPLDDSSRQFIRQAGWLERTAAAVIEREYLGVPSLGNIDGGDTAYFFFDTDTSATSFNFDGPVDEAVQTYGDSGNGNFDKRTDILTLGIRIFGKTYQQTSSVDIGVADGALLGTNAKRFPLNEGTDLTIQGLVTTTVGDLLDDIITAPVTPYDQMDIEYFAAAQTRSGFNAIGGDTPSPGDAQFGVIIDADNNVGGDVPTAEQIYAFVQASLQDTADIDAGAGTRVGLLQPPLVQTVGSALETVGQPVATAPAGGSGVAIDNFSSNDTNRISFVDNDGDTRTFPFVAAGSILFNDNLQNEPVGEASYWMFFTDANGNQYGSASAIIVEDNSVVDIQGDVDTVSSVAFDFDYDGNIQGGRTPATDADITIVAIGTEIAQFVVATGTITRNTGQNFSLVAALERNYSNP